MTNEIFRVDTKKVAKQAGGLGELLMMKCQSGNLLITGQFVLSLSEDQFFSSRPVWARGLKPGHGAKRGSTASRAPCGRVD